MRNDARENIFKLGISAAASKFVCGFSLELMYISLIDNIRSSLTHLHGFQLFVLLPSFIEITFLFVLKDTSSDSKIKFRQTSPGIDSYVQLRLNLGFNWALKPG